MTPLPLDFPWPQTISDKEQGVDVTVITKSSGETQKKILVLVLNFTPF